MHLKLEALVEEMIGKGVHFEDALREFERCFILKILARSKGNVSSAAQILGLHRNTLATRLKGYRRTRAKGAGGS